MDLKTNMNLSDSSSKMQKSSEDQDRISNLPDIIIGHILSLLSTREAVRTSVLSKRWEYMWTFITKLHFNDRDYKYRNYIRKNSFLNSVYRVLLHLNSSSIQSLSISISESYDFYHLKQWMSVMIGRKVKEIRINSGPQFEISSHSPIWKSRSLEKLVLRMYAFPVRHRRMEDYDIRATIPTLNVDFLSLTVLRLYGIPITCVPPNSVQELRLNFPSLRKYKTVNCTWINVKRISIEMPKLEVLIIEDTNVIMSDSSQCVINLCASHLVEFSYSGQMSDTMSVALTIKSVASANIYPRYILNGFPNALFAYQFLSTFNDKVERLRFEHPQVLAPAVNSMVGLPEFEMLTDLEVVDKITGSLLWFLLLKAPFIETLTLKELLSFEHPSTPNLVPPCVASKLEVVNFGRFQGNEHELRFAKLVFENAQVLKRVNFTCPWPSYGKKLKEKILAFERSASAVIEFI